MEPTEEPLKDLRSDHIGTIWKHARSGRKYRITALPKMKDPQDGNWYRGVLYIPLDNSHGLCYARYETDFLEKFKLEVSDGSEQE